MVRQVEEPDAYFQFQRHIPGQSNVVFRSSNATAAKTFAQQFASELRAKGKLIQVYGANECPIEKIRSSYRFQVLVRSKNPARMLDSIREVSSSLKVPYNVSMDIDVDPIDLL